MDQLAETATLNLEQSAEDLTVREQLNRASNDRVRQAIEDGQTAKVRADIGRMFEVRKKVRLTLLLPEVPPRG